jgi:hypothetical protein
MKKILITCFVLSLYVVFMTHPSFAASPDAIQGLIASHMEDVPLNTTQIDIEWSVADGYTGYFYAMFSKASEYTQYTFDEDSTEGLLQNTTGASSYNHESGSDETYYFHVVAVWLDEFDEENFGPTTSYGPIIVDITPPSCSVDAPDTTTTRTVSLSFITDDAIKVYVSNINFGEGSELDLSANNPMSWDLPEGEGEKRVYVRFMDRAGNTCDTYKDIDYYENTPSLIESIDNQYTAKNTDISIPFSITDTEGGSITISAFSESVTLVAINNLSITSIGGVSSSNAYTTTVSAEENLSLTLSITPITNMTGTTTISLTITDAAGSTTTTSFPITIFTPGDVNNNGTVELEDVQNTFYFYMGKSLPTDLQKKIANVYDDVIDNNTVSLHDLQGVFRLYSGFPLDK